MACLFSTVLGCSSGAAISGSFIPGGVGEIAFWDTATTIGGEAAFVYDSTNNRQVVIAPTGSGHGWSFAAADMLVLDSSSAPALNLIGGNTGGGSIFFSDTAARGQGVIEYLHSTNDFVFSVSASTVVLGMSATEAVFNNGALGIDFRVESDLSTHAFFVDGTNNRIGIHSSDPNTKPSTVHIVNRAASLGETIVRIEAEGGAPTGGHHYFLVEDETGKDNFLVGVGQTVVNESSLDHDFRVEGATDTQLLKVDAGQDMVGIGETTPQGKLHIYAAATPQVRIGSTATSNAQDSTILGIATSGSDYITETVAGDTVLMAKTAGHIYFASNTAGAQAGRVIFAKGGNVGINNMIPNNPLTVAETSVGTQPSDSLTWTACFHDNAVVGGVGAVGVVGGNSGSANIYLGQTSNGDRTRLRHTASTGDFSIWTESGAVVNISSIGTFSFNMGQTRPDTNVRFELIQATGDLTIAWRQISETVGNAVEHVFLTGTAGSAVTATNQLGKIYAEISQANPSALQSFMAFEVNSGDANLEFMRATPTELVVNEASADYDFRVESDNLAGALFVDAAADAISIGGATALAPAAQLHVVQDSTIGAKAVLELDQDDIDQPFIDFDGQISANATDSISTLGTPGAISHWLQIDIEGVGKRWIAAYQDPS
jgi:hypothetical protein